MDVKKIAVIGAGLMGSGISYVSAWNGYDVSMVDINDIAIEKGKERLGSYVGYGVKKGKLSEPQAKDLLGRIITTTNLDQAVKDVDLVIEAVFEEMDVKKKVLEQADKAADARTIIASNTSSLSISEMASVTKRPDKVVGMHYFSPVPAMKLLEIIIGDKTSDDTIATALAVGEKQGKTTVKVKDSPGFIVNRLLMQIRRESILAFENGLASIKEIDTASRDFGNMPVGPFELADFVGLDISNHTMSTLYRELGECFEPPMTLKNLVKTGNLGRKTGRGFYSYDDEAPEPIEPKGVDLEELALRITLSYLREAMIMVEKGITTKEDIDTGMKLGTNFSKGPFEVIEEIGLERFRVELGKLYNDLGECYSFPKMLG